MQLVTRVRSFFPALVFCFSLGILIGLVVGPPDTGLNDASADVSANVPGDLSGDGSASVTSTIPGDVATQVWSQSSVDVATPVSASVATSVLAGGSSGLSVSVSAHDTGRLPLDSPVFQNPWDVPGDVPGSGFDDASSRSQLWQPVLTHYYAARIADTIQALHDLLAHDQDEVAVRQNLAVVYKDAGDYEAAAAQYRAIASLRPDDANVLIDWGFALLAAERIQESRELFQRALMIDAARKWGYFGLAVASLALGDDEEASRALTQATIIDPDFAVAHELLGLTYLQQGEYLNASTALSRALRLDSSYLTTYYHLAQAYERLGQLTDAWNYYDRSSRIFGSRPEIQADVQRFVSQHQAIVMAVEESKGQVRESLLHTRVDQIPGSADAPLIRVGLLEQASSVTFSAGSAFRIGSTEQVFPAGRWEVALDGGRPKLTGASGDAVFLADVERFTLTDPSATFIVYDLNAGQGYFWARREDRQVRGELEVLNRPNGLTLVNELDVESYLVAVVPSEVYASMHPETLKAQAIAARTYALRSLGRYRSRGFDVLGSVASTEYKGVEREHPATTQAVIDTQGQVLTYRGRLADTVYSSNAGGYTVSGQVVWGGEVPYLVPRPEWGPDEAAPRFPLAPKTLENWLKYVPDVYSSRSDRTIQSTFRWVYRVPVTEIEARVNAVASIGRIVDVIVGERSIGGYVSRVTIVGTEGQYEVRGDRIRSMLGGLKSNVFKIEKLPAMGDLPASFMFFGAGFGHGVGLSQFGAAGMAEEGINAYDILAHYYPGTEIRGNYNR